MTEHKSPMSKFLSGLSHKEISELLCDDNFLDGLSDTEAVEFFSHLDRDFFAQAATAGVTTIPYPMLLEAALATGDQRYEREIISRRAAMH